jgi:hypothetical protein
MLNRVNSRPRSSIIVSLIKRESRNVRDERHSWEVGEFQQTMNGRDMDVKMSTGSGEITG